MEILEEKPLMLWDVMRLLERRKGDKEKWDKTEQRRVYEYAKKIVKLPEEKARELYERLVDEVGVPPVVAVQIVDILPLIESEVRHFITLYERLLADEGGMLTEEEKNELIRKILTLTREYDKYRIVREESEGGSRSSPKG